MASRILEGIILVRRTYLALSSLKRAFYNKPHPIRHLHRRKQPAAAPLFARHSLLALLPILLVAVSLAKGVKPAVLVGWTATTTLLFYWGADGRHYLEARAIAPLTTANIHSLGIITLQNHT